MLAPGQITITASGDHSFDVPNSAAEAVFNVGWSAYTAALAEFSQPVPTDPKQLAAVKKGLASMSAQFAAFTQYLLDHAQLDLTNEVLL